MKKVFISQPMKGISEKEIKKNKKKAIEDIKRIIGSDIEIIDSYIEADPPEDLNIPVWYLAKSLEYLSQADIAYFCKGFSKSNGCVIEHDVCLSYGIPIIKER